MCCGEPLENGEATDSTVIWLHWHDSTILMGPQRVGANPRPSLSYAPIYNKTLTAENYSFRLYNVPITFVFSLSAPFCLLNCSFSVTSAVKWLTGTHSLSFTHGPWRRMWAVINSSVFALLSGPLRANCIRSVASVCVPVVPTVTPLWLKDVNTGWKRFKDTYPLHRLIYEGLRTAGSANLLRPSRCRIIAEHRAIHQVS